jgi:hypothetical protein
MRVLKTIFYLVLVVVGILVAAANMQEPAVNFVYLPAIPFTSIAEPLVLQGIPVPFLVLGSVVLGALIAGSGSLLEHARLRMGVTREKRRNDRQAREIAEVRGQLEQATRRAEESEARTAEAVEKAEEAARELEVTQAALTQARRRAEAAEAASAAVAGVADEEDSESSPS